MSYVANAQAQICTYKGGDLKTEREREREREREEEEEEEEGNWFIWLE